MARKVNFHPNLEGEVIYFNKQKLLLIGRIINSHINNDNSTVITKFYIALNNHLLFFACLFSKGLCIVVVEHHPLTASDDFSHHMYTFANYLHVSNARK